MLKSAIWWTTMACNFKCKYCWEVQAQERGEFKPEPFRPARDWLEAWNRLRPQLLDITGGEPFLMPDLLDVLLEPWIWENRRAGLEVVKPDVPLTVLCSGGVDHINVQPDGSAWRCILERQLGLNALGNVFDPGFELLRSTLKCADSWLCPACDRDKVSNFANR